MKKGDRVSVIDQTGMEGWGLDDCTILFINGEIVYLKVNKGASHMFQDNINNIKPHLIKVGRLTAIQKLKEKFYGNYPESWSQNSNTELAEWYAEYILNDRTIKVELF